MALVVTNVAAGGWIDAHATFYGDMQGHTTEQGACGYDVFKEGYGLETTALSTALFENGAKCGSCFEIKCVNSKWCKPGAGPIKVTATNFCPPSTGPEAWCNAPMHHFDLTEPMFLKFAIYQGGIVPVQYRRIRCARQGGVKFMINGNPYFLLVLVYNVGGVGDVTGVQIKSSGNWVSMNRNWGMNWSVGQGYTGHALSFKVTTSDGRSIQADNVAPANWRFGQSFESKSQF
ncbi:expansin-A23-like [Silene latifolia]|uniref:expansin-A23-like n=1 Tax=Silene latifolia TaxID=37657 RepID=UPI003D78AA56